MRIPKVAASGLALALTAVSAVVSSALPAHAAVSTLVVNANQPFRPVTHVATGSLYGLATATVPADNLVQPLHPNTFVQMPAGGHQQGSGDILKVAPEAQRAGAKVVDRLSDYYAGWPYQFSWSSWPTVVQNEVNKVKSSGVKLAAWELWNESDNTWKSANGTYEDFWTRTYRQVRSLDPTTPIQGPSFSDNISDMDNFLRNAAATNTVPDIIAWHELIRSSKIEGDVNTVIALQKKYGITPRPIAIEEYAAPSEVGIPGPLVPYIAKFERLGVRDAELAFWNQSGTLGDLLTARGGQPNGAYWLYKWYGDMSGNMLVTTPYSQTSIDGAASMTSDGRQLSVILGGGTSGSSAVQINGLGSSLVVNGKVHVKVEGVASTGRTGASSGANTLAESDYTVSGGSINVPINTYNTSAYHVVVTPGPGGSTTTTTTRPTTTTTSGGGNAGSGALVTPGGKCLDVAGTGNASAAVVNTCNGGSGQSWSFNSDGSLRTLGGSMCLDASARGTANGTALIIYSCNGQANQQFSKGSNSSIVNAGSGRCVDVPNGSTTDGTALQLYDCWGGDSQKWTQQGGGTTTTTTTTRPPTTTTTTNPATTTTTTGGSGTGGCTATYKTVGTWSGGFQGEVTVVSGAQSIGSWTVTLPLGSGQSISSLWGGTASGSTGTVQVANAPYNGALGAGQSASFGYIATGTATSPTVTCSAG
jgi:hypothetical protein